MPPPTKQMAIRFPIALYEDLKKQADESEITFSEHVLTICDEYLHERGPGLNKCRACNYDNPEHAKLCRRCGSGLFKPPLTANEMIHETEEIIKYHKNLIEIWETSKQIALIAGEHGTGPEFKEVVSRMLESMFDKID